MASMQLTACKNCIGGLCWVYAGVISQRWVPVLQSSNVYLQVMVHLASNNSHRLFCPQQKTFDKNKRRQQKFDSRKLKGLDLHHFCRLSCHEQIARAKRIFGVFCLCVCISGSSGNLGDPPMVVSGPCVDICGQSVIAALLEESAFHYVQKTLVQRWWLVQFAWRGPEYIFGFCCMNKIA